MRIFAPFRSPTAAEYSAAEKVGHFYGIDLLRGLAAITILVWHYQHFYITPKTAFRGGVAVGMERSVQPFYSLLMPFYEHGFWAVMAFWMISGFVFAHVYAGKQTSARDFAIARFARLYPLHLVTLLTIAVIQYSSLGLVGRFLLAGTNDLNQFLQNLFFVSGWGLPGHGGFNGPIWSVSIELAIYAGFFLVARRVLHLGIIGPALIAYVAWRLTNGTSPVNNFGLCTFFFFVGVTLYAYLLKFRRQPLAILVPAIASAAVFVYQIATGGLSRTPWYNVQVFLFVPLVLIVGWLDFNERFRQALAPVKWVGDCTYSTYLWHFPVQVLVMLAFSYFGWSNEVFNHGTAMVVWIAGMLFIARLSFQYIERPAQLLIKKRFPPGTSAPAAPSGALAT